MESYTYSGNSGFFDDLDIEGRNFVIDEWHAEDAFPKTNPENPGPIEPPPAILKDPKSEDDEKKWLLTIVKLDDGSMGFAHTVDSIGVMWRCHPCNMVFEGKDMFREHLDTETHQTVMARPHHKKVYFTKLVVEAPHIEPGEPVPPGFEDIMQDVCQLQSALDEFDEAPLIGLEFLVELTNRDPAVEPRYICLLCDKRGDPRSILKHLTSQSHYHKYLGRYFRLAYVALNNIPKQPSYKNGLSNLTQHIVGKIEEQFGRLRPKVMEEIRFNQAGERAELTAKVDAERHFRESTENSFAELVDIKYVKNPELLRPPKPKAPEPNHAEENSKSSSTNHEKSRVPFKSKPVTGNIRKRQDSPELIILNENSSDSKYNGKKSRKSTSPISSGDSPSRSRRSKDFRRSRSKRRSRSVSKGPYGGASRRLPYRRSRSPSYPRPPSLRTRSPRRSRRSPAPRYRRRYSRSRSRSHSRPRSPIVYRRPRSRTRSPYRPRHRPAYSPPSRDGRSRYYPDERHVYKKESSRLAKLKDELKELEGKLISKLKYYEKNPEKHPMYPEEWKLFWNRRFKELQSTGVDPLQHDFKPEWIEFWTKKMVELHEEDLKQQTAELEKKIDAEVEDEKEKEVKAEEVEPGEEPQQNQPDVSVNDIKNLWKAYTGTEIKIDSDSKRSPSPWEDPNSKEKKSKKELNLEPLGSPISDDDVDGDDFDDFSEKSAPEVSYAPHEHYYHGYDKRSMVMAPRMYGQPVMAYQKKAMPFAKEPLNCITVIRSVCVLEDQLGPSLGPKIVDFLSRALTLEKDKPKSSASLLTSSNLVLLETVKEKLKGQFLARVIPPHLVGAAKHAISNIDELVRLAPRVQSPPKFTPTPVFDKPLDPIPVPGVGKVDKVAIAGQIAATLTAQGRTDVSQEELEMLINAVVGMAEAQGTTSVNVAQFI